MVPRLLNFFLFPLHTQVFKPEEYGVFTYLMSVVAVLNIIYTFGMETTYFRFATKPGADEKQVFNQTLTAVIVISATLSALFIASAGPLAATISHAKPSYIIWLSLILLVDNIVSIPFARLRLEKRPKKFAAFRITNVLVLTGLNVYFLFYDYDPAVGIEYVFWANAIANSLYLLFFFRTFLSWRPVYNRDVFPEMLRYAYPIMFTGIAGMMNEFFSRLALEKWLPENFYPGKSSAYALGVFGAGYKFSVIMNLTVQAFRMAGEPFFFSHATNKNSPELFARVNRYFVILGCFILLATCINLDILKYIFLQREEYWEGLNIVPPLLLGYLFLGVYYNFSVWFKLSDKTYYGTFITIGGAVLTVLLNFLLIPWLGYLGSSWATAAVYGAMMIACYLLGQRYFPIPYEIKRTLLYVAVTMALVYILSGVNFGSQWQTTAFHMAILFACAVIVYLVERKDWHRSLA